MKNVELYARVRHAVRIEGLSERAVARRFGIDPRTVSKMMKFSVPPGYVRKKPPAKPKLDPFIPVIDQILRDDKSRPKKQQHTSKRIFERLRDEHGFTGGITIVKDYVAGWRQRAQEMFVPLVHPPGPVQADFGEAIGKPLRGSWTNSTHCSPRPLRPVMTGGCLASCCHSRTMGVIQQSNSLRSRSGKRHWKRSPRNWQLCRTPTRC